MNRQPGPDFAARLDEILDPMSLDDPAQVGEPPAPLRPPALPPEAPTRVVVQRRRWAALLGSLSWLGVHLAVYGIRTDMRELPAPYVVAQIVLPVMVASGSLFVALGAGRLGLGFKVGVISALAVLGPGVFCAIALGAPVPRVPEPGTSWTRCSASTSRSPGLQCRCCVRPSRCTAHLPREHAGEVRWLEPELACSQGRP